MPEVLIEKISLDPTGHLRVKPVGAVYAFVWRNASSVRWDESRSELYVLEVRGFDSLAEFKQIRNAVVNEYGDSLMLSPATEYSGLPHELIAALRTVTGPAKN